jgi:hypothetical protein
VTKEERAQLVQERLARFRKQTEELKTNSGGRKRRRRYSKVPMFHPVPHRSIRIVQGGAPRHRQKRHGKRS